MATRREVLEQRIQMLKFGRERTIQKFDELIERQQSALELIPPAADGGEASAAELAELEQPLPSPEVPELPPLPE